MLIEYPDPQERDVALRALLGLEHHLWIALDDRREAARFDARQIDNERLSSVQFVRFPLGGLDADEFLKLANAGKVAIEVDHPALQVRALINGSLAESLGRDLTD
jgi:hypothetical protein